MSGAGAPTLSVDGTGLRVTVVAASWHTTVMDGLLDGARRALAAANVTDVRVVRVPGTFAAGTCRVEWWNADDGTVVARGDIRHAGGLIALATPSLRRMASNTCCQWLRKRS